MRGFVRQLLPQRKFFIQNFLQERNIAKNLPLWRKNDLKTSYLCAEKNYWIGEEGGCVIVLTGCMSNVSSVCVYGVEAHS